MCWALVSRVESCVALVLCISQQVMINCIGSYTFCYHCIFVSVFLFCLSKQSLSQLTVLFLILFLFPLGEV